MIRFFDFTLSLLGLCLLSPLFLILVIVGGVCHSGRPFFIQTRVGRFGKLFSLVKFRTMYVNTPHLPTHEVGQNAVTPMGRFLRRSKLDELPQLWNVLLGDMSLVGPRPCLPTQTKLIEARKALHVLNEKPGITGLAQIHGVDSSVPEKNAKINARMLSNMTLFFYFKLIFITLFGAGQGDKIKKD